MEMNYEVVGNAVVQAYSIVQEQMPDSTRRQEMVNAVQQTATSIYQQVRHQLSNGRDSLSSVCSFVKTQWHHKVAQNSSSTSTLCNRRTSSHESAFKKRRMSFSESSNVTEEEDDDEDDRADQEAEEEVQEEDQFIGIDATHGNGKKRKRSVEFYQVYQVVASNTTITNPWQLLRPKPQQLTLQCAAI